MGDLEEGYTDATPPSDMEEKMAEWEKEYSDMDDEYKKDGFVQRNNYGDRL